jgi:hypothetical protein
MASDYNRNETAAIDRAAAWIVDLLETYTSGGARDWREALKYEKKGRSGIAVARALMVRGFLEGWKDNPPASTLAGYSIGIAVAAIFGADMQRRFSRSSDDTLRRSGFDATGFVAALEAAAAAHNAAISRRLEAARRECVGEA